MRHLIQRLEDRLGLTGFEPVGERVVVLYFTFRVAWAALAIVLYVSLRALDRQLGNLLRKIARASSENTAARLAAFAVLAHAFFLTLRLATGFRIGYESKQPPEPEGIRRMLPRRTRVFAEVVGNVPLVPVALAAVALRRSIPNLLIWLVVAWYFGWLEPVAKRLADFKWTEIQASQVAAVLGLLVVAWTVFTRSDVRGRVEFNKVASVETRKRLHQMLPHLLEMIKAEHAVRKIVASRLTRFPENCQLERLTGHHGLRWSRGHIVVEESCSDHNRHTALRNRHDSARMYLWRDHPIPERLEAEPEYETIDAALSTHFRAAQNAVGEIRTLGYYSKLFAILPRSARAALADLQSHDDWNVGGSKRANERVRYVMGAGWQDRPDIRQQWENARSTTDLKRARRRAEKCVRRVAGDAFEEIWEGYLRSARLDALVAGIVNQPEHLIDKLKP